MAIHCQGTSTLTRPFGGAGARGTHHRHPCHRHFIGLGFVEDWFFVLGLVIGVIGVGLGLAARRRTPSRMATAAIVLSAIPVVWFIVYMIVDAIA